MATQEIFEELIDTSPIIAEFFSNMPINESVGAMTINDITNSAFHILTGLLEDQGIIFHVDTDELISDYHNARFLIFLFKTFSPTFIKERLNNDQDLYNKISVELDGISDNEYLVHLIDTFESTDRTAYFRDMRVFLFDKITNTTLYASAIRNILDEIGSRGTTQLSDDLETTQFLRALFSERIWCKSIIASIAGKLSLDIRQLEVLSSKFRLDLISSDLAYVYDMVKNGIDINNNPVVSSQLKRLRASSQFYASSIHYRDKTSVSRETVLMLILTRLSDRRIFNIPYNHDCITTTFPEHTDFVSEALRLITLQGDLT